MTIYKVTGDKRAPKGFDTCEGGTGFTEWDSDVMIMQKNVMAWICLIGLKFMTIMLHINRNTYNHDERCEADSCSEHNSKPTGLMSGEWMQQKTETSWRKSYDDTMKDGLFCCKTKHAKQKVKAAELDWRKNSRKEHKSVGLWQSWKNCRSLSWGRFAKNGGKWHDSKFEDDKDPLTYTIDLRQLLQIWTSFDWKEIFLLVYSMLCWLIPK